jgi:hypothetical protein
MSSFYQDPLPFGHSDAVVVGKVTSGQTHLSNDKRDIYCEFEVTVQEALKVPGALSIQANETIDIERQGGAVRLPSGKVLLRGSKDYSMPLIGKRYLLFLKYSQSTEDFHVVTGYQLEGRHTYKLDELGYSYSERHHETLIHPLRVFFVEITTTSKGIRGGLIPGPIQCPTPSNGSLLTAIAWLRRPTDGRDLAQ